MTDPKHEGLPVAGYKPQDEIALAKVNLNKQLEEAILTQLDALASQDDIDKRWLAIGRTQIEQGFMAVNRAVFQPERAKLWTDEEREEFVRKYKQLLGVTDPVGEGGA
jgi:hypothetical protein